MLQHLHRPHQKERSAINCKKLPVSATTFASDVRIFVSPGEPKQESPAGLTALPDAGEEGCRFPPSDFQLPPCATSESCEGMPELGTNCDRIINEIEFEIVISW